jgi:hypothetical protein
LPFYSQINRVEADADALKTTIAARFVSSSTPRKTQLDTVALARGEKPLLLEIEQLFSKIGSFELDVTLINSASTSSSLRLQ